MYSGLRPSIEIIRTGAAWAASVKATKRSGRIQRRRAGRRTNRRTKWRAGAFMRRTPPEIFDGNDRSRPHSQVKFTSERRWRLRGKYTGKKHRPEMKGPLARAALL